MAEFVMPILGADMQAGTLVAWRKRPGDRVRRGEIVADVETEKGLIEVEIFTSGVIERLLVAPGQTVPVGTVLAIVQEEGAPAEARPPAVPIGPPAPMAPAAPPGRVRISPLARTLAARLGVDPATVPGTGPGGAITQEDVERAAAARAPTAPPAGAVDRQAQLRQTIAAAMARSKREIPHYYLGTTIDLGRALAWLGEENARRPVPERLLCAALLVKAVALALREVPELNAVWAGGQVVPSPAIHVGMAIFLRQGGLVAPALHDTDRQSLGELMRNMRDLVKRARAGTLRSSELGDPTITVTNLGEQGVETVFGIVYPPQVAIVGFGKVAERPWSVDGRVVSRPLVTATLSADHRVTDGHRGALFLAAVDRWLQEPSRL
ncbi:MAG: 2-oxo acid dehydrogenase subunit E2 [Candidatus Rokubacteria bacterium]|nr:2-oxo acid dehydrogenase subunit E2 [Candidatus Rokubacteria bacterium]